ncbi:hypothetical protein EZJ43_07905 [Pedobacter changchengzhani]|uniref:Uncharacterized protein n=1 Tax=Pedobacter changchengzhani TaxID=2529274 RepID=A0A4R5ML68_9SPHI|nr:hypothetical protein [Pedobacter changchengzhani]TDG36434.1 hypothetical protein EZJ43_07905 [Pedobacter changchengzhani]
MGNRSYLYLKNENEALNIFDANNSLPFFWLLLLDKETLGQQIEVWKKAETYESTHDEEETEKYLALNSNEISISKQRFEINAKNGRIFLLKHFPKTIPLFDDFIDLIKEKSKNYDHLELDISQFSGFYNSLDEFCDALNDELLAIEADEPLKIKFLIVEDLIGHGTGFENAGNVEFTALTSYQNALKNRGIPTFKTVKKFNKKALLINIGLLFLCPAFSVLAYKMFQQDGFKLSTLLLSILNVGFYCAFIWNILAQIKSYRKENVKN